MNFEVLRLGTGSTTSDRTGTPRARYLLHTTKREDNMRGLTLAVVILLCPLASYAQAPAPGSNAGGAVGPSVTNPTAPLGTAPPGTPDGDTAGDRALRDAAGQNVIGKTETPVTAVPGNTTGPDSGVRK